VIYDLRVFLSLRSELIEGDHPFINSVKIEKAFDLSCLPQDNERSLEFVKLFSLESESFRSFFFFFS